MSNIGDERDGIPRHVRRAMEVAGDVVPIRPPGAPANTSARQNQIKNQQRQSPNVNDPSSNIVRGPYG